MMKDHLIIEVHCGYVGYNKHTCKRTIQKNSVEVWVGG